MGQGLPKVEEKERRRYHYRGKLQHARYNSYTSSSHWTYLPALESTGAPWHCAILDLLLLVPGLAQLKKHGLVVGYGHWWHGCGDIGKSEFLGCDELNGGEG
jgi:hypothetical protein